MVSIFINFKMLLKSNEKHNQRLRIVISAYVAIKDKYKPENAKTEF